jgi:hypothetical protein
MLAESKEEPRVLISIHDIFRGLHNVCPDSHDAVDRFSDRTDRDDSYSNEDISTQLHNKVDTRVANPSIDVGLQAFIGPFMTPSDT